MSELDARLLELEPMHREALTWFNQRAGEVVPWPGQVNGLFLVNKAKGIHKPAGWRHVLSVRQVLNGPYADKTPVTLPGGTWLYDYFQEGSDPALRDTQATNRGLVACMEDNVPVAVLHQVKGKPGVQYQVLGLARVTGWDEGYFHLHGYNAAGELAPPPAAPKASSPASPAISLEDARTRIATAIVARQGSGAFRALVVQGYGRKCALSTCNVLEALEAAHIIPYLGPHTDRLENALLLRADLHTLFDRQLLSIDPTSLRVSLAPELRETSYAKLHGKQVRLPSGVSAVSLGASLRKREDLMSTRSLVGA